MTTADTSPHAGRPAVYLRTAVEAEATVDGLLDAVAQLAQVAPPHAEIVNVVSYSACPEEAHEADAIGVEAPEHDPTTYLLFTAEWPKEENE